MNGEDIETILEKGLLGATIDRNFSEPDHGLSEDHPFSWERIAQDPKGDHGKVDVRGSWYKTMSYEVLHSGGFVRIFTMRGRAYWNAQNESEHTTPDWKLHFSCELNDIGRAWNSLVALFMDMKCEIGMKATVLTEAEWSEDQRGREITVYIYRFHSSYRGYMQGVIPDHDHELYLGIEWNDIYNCPFWINFITDAERRLESIGVRSRGTAEGDLALPGCRYASLRNEAYVPSEETVTVLMLRSMSPSMNDSENQDNNIELNKYEPTETATSPTQYRPLVYPPNSAGWNAASHPNPVLDVVFFLNIMSKWRSETDGLRQQLNEKGLVKGES